MSPTSLAIAGDPSSIWGVNVLVQATVAAAIALAISLGLRRAAALRYAVLLPSLLLILLTPLTAGVMQWSGRGWLLLHPLVRRLNRHLAQAREEVCDNYVLAATDAPSYSRTLLMLTQLAQSGSLLPGAVVGLFTSRWRLERRVSGLLDERRSRTTRLTLPGWAFARVVTAALACVTAFATISVAVDDNRAGTQESSNARSPIDASDERAAAAPAEAPRDDGLLTLRLKVRMPSGSPAAGAIVESSHQYPELDKTARADESGRAVIREVFGSGARVYARSADGAFQATLQVMAHEVRSAFEKALQLKLTPAVDHQVVVVAEGKPAADVQVVAAGHNFKVFGKTGPDGVATLKVPADDRVNEVVAWHPQRGCAGIGDIDMGVAQGPTKLALLAPAPLTIRIVDPQGNPVPGMELRASFFTEGNKDWIIGKHFPAAQVRSDGKGEAVIPWAPRDNLNYVSVDIIGARWKQDENDRKQLSQRVVTLHVRRQKRVAGRLIMPAGASAEGILITGFGFGPGNNGCIPAVRARRDGTFEFDCPSEHAFVLGVFDREWASTPWAGLILADKDDEQAKIAIPVHTAIALMVRVTRGPDHVPDANAWIDVQQRGDVHWVDAQGKDRHASGRVGGWLRADSNGIAHAGVARGKIHLNVQSGKWFEERALDVSADDPIDVEFHRPWLGDRKVVAHMTLDGAPYKPSPNLVAKAWSVRKGFIGPIHQPIIRGDHTIEVSFDEDNLKLLVVDRERELSGFTALGAESDSAELVMQPTATYSGTLLDENGEPLADRTLRLCTDSSWLDVVEPQRTDSAGRFKFTSVPVKTKLRLRVNDEEGVPRYTLFDSHRMFEPGELRQYDKVQPNLMNGNEAVSVPPRPLAERLANVFENVRVAGMQALVVLEGDASKNVVRLSDRVLDFDYEPVRAYLPVTISASQLESEFTTIAEPKWPKPADGEIVLVALDGRQQLLGAEAFAAHDVDAAVALARQFLARHRPAVVDARAKLLKAQEEAKREGRRVWVVSGGPRCGPCFRLARWIDEQHELLEKDYVIVKALAGVEEHADEIGREIGGAAHGIPWHVITEPDGKILVTSEGPLGNIGMPSSVEGIRHFRTMLEQTCRRLSTKEIDELIASLAPAE